MEQRKNSVIFFFIIYHKIHFHILCPNVLFHHIHSKIFKIHSCVNFLCEKKNPKQINYTMHFNVRIQTVYVRKSFTILLVSILLIVFHLWGYYKQHKSLKVSFAKWKNNSKMNEKPQQKNENVFEKNIFSISWFSIS